MKKLRIALTLLFALSCSLFLFACGGGAKVVKRIDSMTGQKTSFKEMEDFSVGDLKVVVVYEGSDEKVTLTSEQYKIDSSAYKKDQAGEYSIKVIPTEQNVEEGEEEYYESYSVTVEHDFQKQSDGTEKCSGCGAVRESRTDLTSKVVTTAWGNQAAYTPGENPYPNAKAPIPGENHVAVDILVKGQSLSLTLKIDEVDSAATWNTPLMGFRNGADGALPREDGWVIGTAAGYTTPGYESGQTATAGEANAQSAEWLVYGSGETWIAEEMLPSGSNLATDIITYDYTVEGIMRIRHEFTSADGSVNRVYTYSVKVPDAAYEIAAYGEKVSYTITESAFTASRTVSKFEATTPTETKQAEGKMFDTAGIKAVATFSDNDTFEGQYNAYAYIDVAREVENEDKSKTTVYDKTRVNIMTEPLQAGMYDFCVEFGGKTVWFTKNGEETPVTDNTKPLGTESGLANSLIEVIPTQVSGGVPSVVELDGVAFESPSITVDYTLNSAKNGIDLTVKGDARKATADQKAKLNADYFVAFTVLSTKGEAATAELTGAQGSATVVNGEGTLKNIRVIAGLSSGTKSFKLVLKDAEGNVLTSGDMTVNLGVTYPAVTVAVTDSNFTLDKGGDYTVVYEGFAAGDLADESKIILHGSTQSKTFAEAKNGVSLVGESIKIKSAKIEGTKLTVVYTLGAPSLTSIKAENAQVPVSVEIGSTTVATTLYYNFQFSSDAIALEDSVYAISSGNKLLLVKAFEVDDVRDGLRMTVSVNIQNANATSYNLGVVVKDGDAAFIDSNDIADHKSSSAKLVTFGRVNYNGDSDRGALLIAAAHLPALDLRATSSTRTQKYFFTSNEDTVNGKSAQNTDTYIIYTVDGDNITKTTSTPTGERTKLLDASCLIDGVSAYTTPDGFKYGALASPASGQHTWVEDTAAHLWTCSVCKSITNYQDAMADVAESTKTPALGDGLIESGLTVSFMVKNATGDWASRALVSGEGNVIITLPNLDPWNNSVAGDILNEDGSVAFAKVSDPTDRELTLGGKLASTNLFPTANNTSYLVNGGAWDSFLNNYFHVVITVSTKSGIRYYRNGELLVSYPADAAMGGSNVGEFAELFLSLAERHGLILSDGGAPMSNFMLMPTTAGATTVKSIYDTYVAKFGAPEMPRVATAVGEVPANALTAGYTEQVTVGTDGTTGVDWTGYSVGKTWYIKKGQVVTISGTLKAPTGSNWFGVGMIFDRGLLQEDKIPQNGRIDNFVNGSAYSDIGILTNCAPVPVAMSASQEVIGDWVAEMIALRSGGNTTVYTFDYSNANQLVVKMEITGSTENAGHAGNVFTQSYTITPHPNAVNADGSAYTLDDYYLIGLAVDTGYFTGSLSVK